MSFTDQLLNAKVGSRVRLEMDKRAGDTEQKFNSRVTYARAHVKRKGVITIEEAAGKGVVIVTLLNDLEWPASEEELALLHNKGAPTLIEWAKKRKRSKATPSQEPEGAPLVQVLEPQDPGRAASRMSRVAAGHVEVGHVPAPTNGAKNNVPMNGQRPAPVEPEVVHEEQTLWREVYVTDARANPLGSDEHRASSAKAAVEAFRSFFGV